MLCAYATRYLLLATCYSLHCRVPFLHDVRLRALHVLCMRAVHSMVARLSLLLRPMEFRQDTKEMTRSIQRWRIAALQAGTPGLTSSLGYDERSPKIIHMVYYSYSPKRRRKHRLFSDGWSSSARCSAEKGGTAPSNDWQSVKPSSQKQYTLSCSCCGEGKICYQNELYEHEWKSNLMDFPGI